MSVHDLTATQPPSCAPPARPGPVELCWEGDLDIASGPVLTTTLRVLAQLGAPAVRLDLQAVRFMDCAGLGALLDGDARLPGGVQLVAPSRPVLRVLALVGLADRFPATDPDAHRRGAPDPRTSLDQAKGVVVAGFGTTVDQATKILLGHALRHGVPVQVLAGALVAVASAGAADPGGPAWGVQQVLGVGDTGAGVDADAGTTSAPVPAGPDLV